MTEDILGSDGLVVVDDLRSAARFLSPLGQALLAGHVELLSARVAELAADCGWQVVDHRGFAAWVEAIREPDEPLVVLDKLLDRPDGTDSVGLNHRLPAHRHLGVDGALHLDLGSLPAALSGSGSRGVTLVDDAAYTSGTLVAVASLLERVGVRVRRVLLAVSTARAEDRLRTSGVHDVLVFHPQRATDDIIHARDLCFWCPYSGRAPTVEAGQASTGERIAPLLHQDGAWLTDPRLASDLALFDVVADGIAALGRYLGRDPHPEDLALLGPHVAVPAGSGVTEFAGLGLGALLAAHRERRPCRERTTDGVMVSSVARTGDLHDHLARLALALPGVELRSESFTSPAARRLLALADAYNTELYGHADASPLEPGEFEPARGGLFLVAYRDGEPVACAGLRAAHPPAPSGAGEVKRMYVVDVARRQGLGQLVLGALEEAARRFGYGQVVLDAGRKQMAAHALYEARGYHRIPGFTIYRDSPGNRAYAKSLPLRSPEG